MKPRSRASEGPFENVDLIHFHGKHFSVQMPKIYGRVVSRNFRRRMNQYMLFVMAFGGCSAIWFDVLVIWPLTFTANLKQNNAFSPLLELKKCHTG